MVAGLSVSGPDLELRFEALQDPIDAAVDVAAQLEPADGGRPGGLTRMAAAAAEKSPS